MTTQTLDIRAEIRRADDAFEATFARGDAAALTRLYTEGAMLLPTDSNFIRGRPAIQAFWQSAMEMGVKQVALEIVELEQHDNTAVEVGRYALRDDAGHVLDRGKYVVIWKQQDGEWKLHRDIWNSSVAPPEE